MPDARSHPSPAAARALLAHAALGLTPRQSDAHVGPLALRAYQRHAVARLRYALQHYRVALLADDVGLGKTAVALAILRDTPNATIIAPAALRTHWTAALHTAGLTRRLLTTESLGRASARDDPAGSAHAPPTDLLIVDEAHHFRNPRTHRWRRLATLAANARLLLISATPVHNRPDDLAALFALTLGARAHALDSQTLARLVVRRAAADIHRSATAGGAADVLDQPTVTPTVWLDLDDTPELLATLRALPPALAPSDGTATPNLDRYTLVRLWTSSAAALRAGLDRRLARALAIGDALAVGQPPTRAALLTLTRGITTDPTTIQLSFPTPDGAHSTAAQASREQLDAYVAALHHARATLRGTAGDAQRIAYLRDIRAHHPNMRIVAFSYSSDTVRALYRALTPDGRIGMLTATGGRIASGPLPRADILARFAPLGQSRTPPAAIERIDLLLTTDVLSEGLDLRDASVVVHLDLPWTPARLAQRTGRAVRPGASTRVVHVYAFRAPPSAARDLRLAAHAYAKRRAVTMTVGTTALDDALAPSIAPLSPHTSVAVAQLARDRQLEHWSERWNDLPASDRGSPIAREPTRTAATPIAATRMAAVRCRTSGYLAVVALPTCLGALRIPTLVAALDSCPPTRASAVVRRALAQLESAKSSAEPSPAHVRYARRQLARWARRRLARDAVLATPSICNAAAHRGHRHDPHAPLLARAARALQTAAPQERVALAAAAGALRTALAAPLSAEHETAIRNANPQAATDAAWLAAAARVASAPDAACPAAAKTRPALRALVLLVN